VKLLTKVALCLVLLASLGRGVPVLAGQRVVLLYSDSTKHTLRTISGLEWSLKNCEPPCELVQHFVKNFDDAQKADIAGLKANVLLTIGTTATAFADKNFPKVPVVFAKVMNPIESGFINSWDKPGPHVTGAAMDIPVDQQIAKFATVIPKLKSIGVIYSSSSARLVEEARKACSVLGLQLVAIEIATTKELPTAVDSLCHTVDGIWTIADELLSTPQFIRHTLVETLRSHIPIMGFNQNFVENGALFCLEADYKFIGRQAGEMVAALMRGDNIGTIKPTVPDVIYLYLNLKSGRLLNIDLSPELISVAKETY
jgi:putative tryptophan/tyrosine transport system substrate-binding protein